MICNVPVKPLTIRVLYEQIILPFLARKNKIDIFHFPANISPFVLSCPSVLTIHDTCAFTIPEMIPAVLRQYWKIMLRSSAQNANLIIAVSRSSKEDIVRFLGISKEKVQVIYHGSEHQILEARGQNYSLSEQNEAGGRFPYILWVGKLFSHKNLPRLLHAFAKLIETSKMKCRLVICGMRSWGYSPLVKTVKELGLQGKVIFKGYVPHNKLKPIYSNACLFAFPSLIETFGLPILEAMSYGVPVITSNYGAMAEIAGDAALLVDPYSVDEIAEAMHRILTDETLRATLIKKGLKQASFYSL
ncbi:MAG: glycosyltransferase family 1 protein [Candidatus Cloacimonadota bacterium]|nr:MAG: glycosyltransferase family 1 protein [Candidatus Cloacimonadota bacterium]